MLSGNSILVRDSHFANAASCITSNELGSLTLLREVQLPKARGANALRLFGRIIESNAVQ